MSRRAGCAFDSLTDLNPKGLVTCGIGIRTSAGPTTSYISPTDPLQQYVDRLAPAGRLWRTSDDTSDESRFLTEGHVHLDMSYHFQHDDTPRFDPLSTWAKQTRIRLRLRHEPCPVPVSSHAGNRHNPRNRYKSPLSPRLTAPTIARTHDGPDGLRHSPGP